MTVETPCRVYGDQRRMNAHGYVRVPFGPPREDGKGRKMVLLHRWIVEQVEGVPLGPAERVLHRCDNPPCFRYDHLRRGTQAQNVADMWAKGRAVSTIGRHPSTKLATEDVPKVVALLAAGEPERAVAARFGVSRALIRLVRRGYRS